jgi:3-oxoacyl-[acyl-carrier protein] reductase
MNLGLDGKVAIITGASRGIGRAVAQGLAAEGCALVLCARQAEPLTQAADELRATGADVLALPLDVTAPEAGMRLAEAALHRFGRIDVFVGNAGGNRRKPFDETIDADWDELLAINLHAHVRTSRAVIPAMKAAGQGAILFITSIFGREAGGPGLVLYNSTKSALISAAKIMALELAPFGIRVNTVAPGSIRFPGSSWDKRCLEDPDGMAVFIRQNLPFGRFGTVAEVADVVTFLVSARAGWVSGACVNVDGVQSRSLI